MFLLYPSTTFRQVQEVGKLVQENLPGYKPHFFKINPTVGVPSTFDFDIFIFQVPERYAYLSGTGKLKCIDRNFTKSGTRTYLVQMIKVGLGILQITSAKRCPQVWPQNYRSLYTTKVFDFASYLCSNKHRES